MFDLFGPGSGVIRVGDTTDHGGTVMTGQNNFLSHGKPVAVVGDVVYCPKHGAQRIIEGLPSHSINDKPTAFHGCLTTCGARLISSLNQIHCIGADDQGAGHGYEPTPVPAVTPQATVSRYMRQFRVVDSETGQPLVNRPFTALVDGVAVSGTTDAGGIATVQANRLHAAIELHVIFQAPIRALDEFTGRV